ncbi:MAG TPA: hypothetical protein VN258_16120 [Mobilitalea sp.]|nr:hypothetical protein [Mobilitalea sp.]
MKSEHLLGYSLVVGSVVLCVWRALVTVFLVQGDGLSKVLVSLGFYIEWDFNIADIFTAFAITIVFIYALFITLSQVVVLLYLP